MLVSVLFSVLQSGRKENPMLHRPSRVKPSIGRALLALLGALVSVVSALHAEPEWAWRRWEYINTRDVEVTVRGDKPEMPAGDCATFTVTVRNRTDKCVKVDFFGGQHADLAVYHHRAEIWRWSQYNRYTWRDARHSLPINPGETLTFPMMWKSVDRMNQPLPQGDYRIVGVIMSTPRRMMSNATTIRLTPPRRYRDTIYVKIMRPFELKLPRFLDGNQVYWHPYFDYNDNRLDVINSKEDGDQTVVRLLPKRLGHVTVNFLGYKPLRGKMQSRERRAFRIEVVDYDPYMKNKKKPRPTARPATPPPTTEPAAEPSFTSDIAGTGTGSPASAGSGSGSGSRSGGTAVITSLDGSGSGSDSGSASPVATSAE